MWARNGDSKKAYPTYERPMEIHERPTGSVHLNRLAARASVLDTLPSVTARTDSAESTYPP